MIRKFIKFDTVTVNVTPIPTSNVNFRVAGYEWQDLTTWATDGGHVGLTIYFTSYNRQLQIVVYSDTVSSNTYSYSILLSFLYKLK